MLKNAFILSVRNLVRQKQTTIISIIGLVIALSVILQIANWCNFETSFDKYHSKAERIYRFSVEENRPEKNFYWHFARSWQTWRTKLPEFYPEIERLIELRPMWHTTIRSQKNIFYCDKVFAVDSSVFHVFDFYFIAGNPETAINGEKTIVISESLAKKCFSDLNGLDQIIELYDENRNDFEKYTITGIYKDLPENSHFHIDMLVHYKKQELKKNDFAYTYILLKDGTSIDQVECKSDEFIKTHVPEGQQKGSTIHYTPITDIHLKSHIEREIEPNGDIKQVKLVFLIGLGILIIALINYINLLVSSFEKRIRNFHINITIGAKQKHNVLLLFTESLMIALIVTIISGLLSKPFTWFLISSEIIKTIPFSFNIINFLIVTCFFIIVVLCGILPVLIMRINPARFFSKHIAAPLFHSKINIINKPLLVLQFAVSIIVIISSLMLNKQNKFIFSRNLTCKERNIIKIDRNFNADENDIMRFKEELLKLSAVDDVTMSMSEPGSLVKDARNIEYADIPAENKNQIITILPVDANFFSFFNIPLVAGSFKEYITNQTFENYILNESAIKKLGFVSPEQAIGTKFKIDDVGLGQIKGGIITGVIKDFNFASLYYPIEPTIFFQKPIWQWSNLIKLAPGNQNENIVQIKKLWDQMFPEYPFDYQLLDNVYKEYYRKDIITGKLVSWFSAICIILSSIGLWGVSSILVTRKTKEIGVRKVNGARSSQILSLLNKDFIRWIIAAYIISAPVAWYLISVWFENFAYKTGISWQVFALGGTIAMGIALLTVSLQSYKTAMKNPTESLKYE